MSGRPASFARMTLRSDQVQRIESIMSVESGPSHHGHYITSILYQNACARSDK